MSDEYTEEAFKALKDSVDDAIRNTLDAYLDDDQVLEILESLDERGFVILPKPPIPAFLTDPTVKRMHSNDAFREALFGKGIGDTFNFDRNDIPFVIRPIKDIDELERYSVRREEVHGGENYYAYYNQPNLATAERVKAEFDKELGCSDKTKIVVVNKGPNALSAASLSKLPLPVTEDWRVPYPPNVQPIRQPAFMVEGKFNADIHRMMIEEEINNPMYPHQVKPLQLDPAVDLEDLKRKTDGLDPNDPLLTTEQQGWIVQRCQVDREYFEAKVATRIRDSVADLDIAETYPKTVTLTVTLPKDSFKVIVHQGKTVDFIRSRGESFFPREPYLETLKELERLIVNVTDFELHKVQLTRAEFRTKVTAAVTSALGANPQFKGVTFMPATHLNYDIVTRPFDIKLSQTGDTYKVEIDTPNRTYVTEESTLFLMAAVRSVIEGVDSEGKDSVETRRLIIANLNHMFKDNDNFKGVVFTDQLET